MEIRKFIFVPDGHYGYPTPEDGDTPRDYHTLVEEYCDSSYSAWGMGEYSESEPDEDDYETEEEYNEAYAEWEENQESNKVDCYDEWGSYDVFRNSYEMLSDGVGPEDIFSSFFGYEGTSCHDDFMQESANNDDVVYVISRGSDDEIAIAGQVYPLSSDAQEISEILSDTIVNEYRNKNPKSGVIHRDITSSVPGVEDKVRAKLSPEEYEDLTRAGMGGSVLRRLGF